MGHQEDHASRHIGAGGDAIQDATASQDGLMTQEYASKLDGVQAGAQVTDATTVNAAGAVMETDFNANTILRANADNTPLALSMGVSTILGRLSTGNIEALTPTQVRTLLDVVQHFGKAFASNSSLGESYTTLTSYQQKLRLAMTSVPSGSYLIFWGCSYYNDYGDNGQIQVQLDDTTTIVESGEYDDVWNTYRASMGFWFGTLSGNHNVDMDYKAYGTSTEYIKDARIICFRYA